ncbi:glycosyltransferase [Kibdelosporangium phytohabitans]|uniref:glycosyltransferase n=1 Tax=Kibdelosporangium phytohabitans TaxID=860235 RepID=UPI000A6D1764|nr:glycosyltransferase [Kibdelosporangium phytohabitans]MBE1470075.1 hypothetical protein [Kibdelosporangium phytohabitans]
MTAIAIALSLAWPVYNLFLAVFALRRPRPRPRQPEHTAGLHFWILVPGGDAWDAVFDSPRYPVRVLAVGRGADALDEACRAIRDVAADQGIERRTVIGVVDGQPEPGLIGEVAAYFGGRNVGAVQCRVRVPARGGLLGFLQDLESAVAGDAAQRARDLLSGVLLGANGQFVRLDVLARLGDRPWSGSLEHRIDQAGMAIRYATDAVVRQSVRPVRPGSWALAVVSGALAASAVVSGTYVWLSALLLPGLVWGLLHRVRFGGQPWHRTLGAAVLYPIYLGLRRASPACVTNAVPPSQPGLLPWAGDNPGLSARRP